jgi:hypothetical protein
MLSLVPGVKLPCDGGVAGDGQGRKEEGWIEQWPGNQDVWVSLSSANTNS